MEKNLQTNGVDNVGQFEPHFLEYWDYVKDVVDADGWVYSKEVPYILDAYFESNTGKEIEFEKMYQYEGSWRGYRWRPKSILSLLNPAPTPTQPLPAFCVKINIAKRLEYIGIMPIFAYT